MSRIERALFGGISDDGVTWQDGLMQTISQLRGDRKWIFVLLGVIAASSAASTVHAYGIWGLLEKVFGG